MREDGDRHRERRVLGNGRRVGAMALAGAAMATAVIRQRVLPRMRRVVRGDRHPGVTIHLVVGAVLSASMAHLGRGRGDGGKSERPRHAERKLQEQQCAESPSSRAGSHGESLHLGFRAGKFKVHTRVYIRGERADLFLAERESDSGHGNVSIGLIVGSTTSINGALRRARETPRSEGLECQS